MKKQYLISTAFLLLVAIFVSSFSLGEANFNVIPVKGTNFVPDINGVD